MTGADDPTRRDLLAAAGVAGTAAVAGCGALDGLFGSEPTVDGAALAEAVSGDGPGVRLTVPVAIERSYVTGHIDRAESLLSAVPASLDRSDVPNGVVRERITARRDEARTAIDAVSTDDPDTETLDELARARDRARNAVATYAAAENDLTAADIHDEQSAVRTDLDAFQDRRRYVGTDPVGAAVTYGEIESRFETVARNLQVPNGAPNTLWLGEYAGGVERARTHVEHVRYLYDSHQASVSGDTPLRDRFVAARDRLEATVERRRDGLPDAARSDPEDFADGAAADAPAGRALERLASRATSSDPGPYHYSDRVTVGVLTAHRELAAIGAFEWLRGRIEADEYVMPTGTADVRQLRTAAIEAIRAADGGPTPHLTRRVIGSAAAAVAYADREIREGSRSIDDTVSLGSFDIELRRYVSARAFAEAAEDASETVAAELRSS